MDLGGTDCVSYAEFVSFCLGRRKTTVTINFYDLTNGLASRVGPILTGEEVEGLWHTGVVVYGNEYYFGGDIFFDVPKQTVPHIVMVHGHLSMLISSHGHMSWQTISCLMSMK